MTGRLARILTLWPRGLDAIAQRFEATPMLPGAWCDPGVPYAVLVPLVAVLPFVLSGPIRVVLGWSLPASLPLALLATLLVASPLVYVWQRSPPPPAKTIAYVAALLPALFAVALLYRRAFGGLTNYVGADGGVHVNQADQFVHVSPGAYLGFVSMYAWMYWAQRLANCNVFWALESAYYFAVAVVATVPMVIVLPVVHGARSRRVWVVAVAAATLAALFAQYTVILPQLFYHQTDGFFAHIFALVPLMMMWLADAVIRARLVRWVALVSGLAFYRYTYGLNLADALVAIGALVCYDSFHRGGPIVLRIAAGLTLPPMVFAAYVFLQRLEPLISFYGWIVAYDLAKVLAAEVAVVLALVAISIASRLVLGNERLARALRFPIVFTVVNTALAYVGDSWPNHQPYYVLKYPMHASVLAASAAVVMVAATVVALGEVSGRARLGRIVAALPAVAALAHGWLDWRAGYASYEPYFLEGIRGKPPYLVTRPLADLGAWHRIERVLAERQKHFGGYVTWDWPMFNFMNAALGYYNGGRAFWDHGGVNLAPGYCVFWDRGGVGPWSSRSNLSGPLHYEYDQLDGNPTRECVSYRATWDSKLSRTLCHVCQ